MEANFQNLTETTAPKRINVRSFTMEGCIFNDPYYAAKSEGNTEKEAMEIANNDFANRLAISLDNENYDKIILTTGCYKPNDISSLEPINNFNLFIGELTCAFRGNFKKTATSEAYLFEKAMATAKNTTPSEENGSNASLNHAKDSSNLGIILVLTHYAATQYPNDIITYDSYNHDWDTLKGLEDLFQKNPDLLPLNVTLRLHHYAGTTADKPNKANTTLCEIDGTGPIDTAYASNYDNLFTSSGYDHNPTGHNVLKNLSVSRFKAARETVWSNIYISFDGQENISFADNFNTQTDYWLKIWKQSLKSESDLYRDKSNITYQDLQFATALLNLYDTLEGEFFFDINDTKLLEKPAAIILRETNRMLFKLKQASTQPEKIAIIKEYEDRCRQTTAWGTFFKVVGAVIIAAIALTLSFALISLISSGGWADPFGSILKTILDIGHEFATGSITRATVDLLLESVAISATCGAISGHLFFRPSKVDPLSVAVKEVSQTIKPSMLKEKMEKYTNEMQSRSQKGEVTTRKTTLFTK
jgi:hypothetical protein